MLITLKPGSGMIPAFRPTCPGIHCPFCCATRALLRKRSVISTQAGQWFIKNRSMGFTPWSVPPDKHLHQSEHESVKACYQPERVGGEFFPSRAPATVAKLVTHPVQKTSE